MAKRRSGSAAARPAMRASADQSATATSRILSDFEYGLIVGGAAFQYWVDRCMAAAGLTGLSAQDVLILHAVNHRARNKKLADVCLVMHIEDPHVVSYALKKLIAYGLVKFEKRGRERHYATTTKGDEVCQRYRAIRERILVRNLTWLGGQHALIASAASFLRTMTALYDQAARHATVEVAPTPLV